MKINRDELGEKLRLFLEVPIGSVFATADNPADILIKSEESFGNSAFSIKRNRPVFVIGNTPVIRYDAELVLRPYDSGKETT